MVVVDGSRQRTGFHLTGSDFAFPVRTFTGSALNRLTLVAANTGGVSFNAVAGQTYQIAVGDAAGQTGAIAMTLLAPVMEARLVFVIAGGSRKFALLYYLASRAGPAPATTQRYVHRREGKPKSTQRCDIYVTPAPLPRGTRYQAINRLNSWLNPACCSRLQSLTGVAAEEVAIFSEMGPPETI